MIRSILPALLCSVATLGAADISIGYRGNGSGVYPNTNPPTECDDATGKNILWKAPLPHFGHSSPIVVGSRVFVTCEPGWKSDWPQLLCFDANTGKELWRKDLNHLPVSKLIPEEQTRVAEAWHQFLTKWAEGYKAAWRWRTGDDAAKNEADKQLAKNGFQPRNKKMGDPFDGREINMNEASFKDINTLMKKGNLMGETWREGGSLGVACVGQSFATPISDGQKIWTVTAFGGFFCYSLEGQLLWAKHYPGQMGEYCRNGRSPLLWKDLLLSDITALCRAIDKNTGELKWSALVGQQAIITPTIISVAGTDILLCDGGAMTKGGKLGGGKAFRLPDGKELTIDGWTDLGATALTKCDERDVVFFCEGGDHAPWSGFRATGHQNSPAAVRFRLEGETLKTTLLWNGVDGKAFTAYEGLVYHAGKLYCNGDTGLILDALSGKVLAGSSEKGKTRVTPASRHMLVVAGDRLYGISESSVNKGNKTKVGILSAYSLDGKPIGQGTLLTAKVEGGKSEQIGQTTGNETWGFSYSCPFSVSGDRIYARSNDDLICIGKP